MLQLLLGLAATVFVYSDFTEAVCGTPPIVWRNDNITCPARAICADVFKTTRDWYNGTRCEETRVLSNCLCPSGTVCPINNPNHVLFSSAMHRIILCEPVCAVPYCGNIPTLQNSASSGRRQSQGGRAVRSNLPVSVTTVQNAEEFEGKTYNRMQCRCPRHHFPSSRGRRRSVKASRYEFDFNRRRYSTLYVCANNPREREDPCSI